MKLRTVLFTASMLVGPAGVASAQPVTGLYVGGGLGYHWTQHIDINGVTAGPFSSSGGGAQLSGDGGLIGLGSVGWGLGNGFRVELEGNWRANHFRVVNGGPATGGGDSNTYGVMVNGFYDFNIGWPVVPYAGIGIGYEWTSVRGAHATTFVGANPVSVAANSTKGSAATQGILGAAYPFPGVPGLSLTAEYRFMAAFQNEKFNGVAAVPGLGNTGGSIKIGNQYGHAGLIGIRYAFNAAPPPPPPAPAPVAAPAPAPARTYLVFFDWDKADLTDRARQIIGEAAQNSTRVQVTRIEVDGYADRTGTAAYNLRLSRRRADNVAAELVKDGVAKNIITIQAFGDTHLLVPTGPGVREPQNRRVEIILK